MKVVLYIALASLLALASYYDFKERRIPNKLTVPFLAFGVLYHLLTAGLSGLVFSLAGFGIGLGVFFIFFALGFMGAGDAKLMGAIGSMLGWILTAEAILYIAAIGGVIAIVTMAIKGRLWVLMKKIGFVLLKPLFYFLYLKTKKQSFLEWYNKFTDQKIFTEQEYIPYAGAITLGTVLAVLLNITGNGLF
ncbi:A24 family peptidase [Lacticigenium naphthae]|uniref:A24 family peptidase n=1 Tax=Lacticigenium naphthae TaxID=515351 RepID=UPI0003FB557D|nr:A24 family peptidase [Lacticigenium naphthae]